MNAPLTQLELDVSVVFGGNEEHIEACLASIERQRAGGVALAVTVFANDPASALVERLERAFPRMRFVRNASVRGFAENHNQVLSASRADWVLVLNDDVLLPLGSLRSVLEFLRLPGNDRVASVTPRLVNPDSTLQRCTYAFPTVPRALLSVTGLRELLPFARTTDTLARVLHRDAGRSRFWAHDRTLDVDTFRGACMFLRTAAVRQVGLLSEASRIGVEEVEWHRRARDAGWRVVFFAETDVVHYGSRTIRLDPSLRNEYLKGFLHYFDRHRGFGTRALFALGASAALAVRAVLLRLGGRVAASRVAAEGARIAAAAVLRPPGARNSGIPRADGSF